MAEDRYILNEAALKLGVSRGTLINRINRMGLREIVDNQVMEDDRRAHYLTEEQLGRLAKGHRRKVGTETMEQNSQSLLQSTVQIALQLGQQVTNEQFDYIERMLQHKHRVNISVLSAQGNTLVSLTLEPSDQSTGRQILTDSGRRRILEVFAALANEDAP